jgi:hypothetical protein
MSELFTLERNRWYAAEFLGDEFGATLRSYSPIYVREAKPLMTGQAFSNSRFITRTTRKFRASDIG